MSNKLDKSDEVPEQCRNALCQTGNPHCLPCPPPLTLLATDNRLRQAPFVVPRLPPLPRAGWVLPWHFWFLFPQFFFFFLPLRRNQRKLEARGSAEATQGQEVQSTPHFLRGGGFVTATCWEAWATHTNSAVRSLLPGSGSGGGETRLGAFSHRCHPLPLTSGLGSPPELALALNEEGTGGRDT